MSLEDISTILGIASIFVSGASVFLVWIARLFWGLTFDRKVKDDEKIIKEVYNRLKVLEEHELQNKELRHNFKAVTEGLEKHISSEIKHLEEVINLKFKFLERSSGN